MQGLRKSQKFVRLCDFWQEKSVFRANANVGKLRTKFNGVPYITVLFVRENSKWF